MDQLRKFQESSSRRPSPAAGASDTPHTGITPGESENTPGGAKGTPTLDRFKSGRRLKGHTTPER